MQTNTIQSERTCLSLFQEFKDRYSVNDVEMNPGLGKLFTYLQHRCAMANGNYYHEPDAQIKALLKKHMQYETNSTSIAHKKLNQL